MRSHDDSSPGVAPGRGAGKAPRVHRYEVPVTGLDPALSGLKIVQLSDLHVGMLTPHAFIRGAVERARAEQPDLVVMTGDYVCYSPKYVPMLGEVVAGFEVPTVCVLGNHDYWTDGQGVQKTLAKNGYDVLRNQHTRLTVKGAPLTVVGVDDAVTRQSDVERAFLGLKPPAETGEARLVLTHVPSTFPQIAAYGPSLALAGHTHGGHVHIPGVTDRVFKRLGSPYLKGFYRKDDSLLYVNSGIGSSSVPIRAGAPSEIAVFTLRPA